MCETWLNFKHAVRSTDIRVLLTKTTCLGNSAFCVDITFDSSDIFDTIEW